MKRKILCFSFAAALPIAAAVTFAGPASACPPGPPRGPGMRLEKHLDELGLDPAQTEKVQALLAAAKEQRKQVRSELKDAFDQMHTLLQQDPPDEAAIMQQADKIGQLKTGTEKAMLHTLLQVSADLTPEQRQKLEEIRSQHRPRWHKRFGNDSDD